MNQRILITSLFVLAVAIISVVWREGPAPEPGIPAFFASSLPSECRQVLLVLSPHAESIPARLWLMERDDADGWKKCAGPILVTLGQKGLAWGDGEHTPPAPADFRIKHEGDR